MVLFGVFDGHGQEGKVVSHTICQNLPKIMARMLGSKVSLADTVCGTGVTQEVSFAAREVHKSMCRMAWQLRAVCCCMFAWQAAC
jgi:serine/threonine protein phosphatase PrpC